MNKQISGWGRYPVSDAEITSIKSASDQCASVFRTAPGIARGMGRSYGDSALASNIVDTRSMNRLLSFDVQKGILRCEAGVTLAELIPVLLKKGWFLPVTPGTKYITVGGAIASDVHGKNHHSEGCFSQYVTEIKLLGRESKIHSCSREKNPDLFRAVCGGMGLAGIILEAAVKLKKVNSAQLDGMNIKAKDLTHLFELFEEYNEWPYSVAWLDGRAANNKLGRGLFTAGSPSRDASLDYHSPKKIMLPHALPSGIINKPTISFFNFLYYHRMYSESRRMKLSIDAFFYPLDAIGNWNRLYGPNGFLQYQFVLPKSASFIGIKTILETIYHSGKMPALSVLKLMGPENENYLSFPMKGYTLAMDFRLDAGIFPLLDKLDLMVVDFGGRIYLAKDARMKPAVFERGYPKLDAFREVREKYGFNGFFESVQSKRLGI